MILPDAESLSKRLRYELWDRDVERRGIAARIGIVFARIGFGIARKIADGQLTLWAMSLVYTTLLSLVPLLAVSFSVLTAFGARGRLEPLLLDFLAPLGPQGPVISQQILDFVDNIQVGVLGSVGIAFLFYTVISLIQKVEKAFNEIWQVTNARSLARRFSDYLSVILIGPVLVVAALGVTASVLNSSVVQWLVSIEPFGTLVLAVTRLAPYLLICVAFAFLYAVIPNTAVRIKAALVGGIIAGVLWYTTGMLFTVFVVNSSKYSAIYSGFAAAVLFMIWLYIGWLIILVGAQVAYYWQNPRCSDPRITSENLTSRRREELALSVMTIIGISHFHGESLSTMESLDHASGATSPEEVAYVLRALEAAGLIVETATSPPAYLPSHALETIPLADVLAAVRGRFQAGDHPTVDAVMEQIDAAIDQTLRGRTLRDMVLSGTQCPHGRSNGALP